MYFNRLINRVLLCVSSCQSLLTRHCDGAARTYFLMRTHVIPFLIDSGRIDTTLEMYNGMEGHGRVNLKVIRLINHGRRDIEKRWVKPSDRQNDSATYHRMAKSVRYMEATQMRGQRIQTADCCWKYESSECLACVTACCTACES